MKSLILLALIIIGVSALPDVRFKASRSRSRTRSHGLVMAKGFAEAKVAVETAVSEHTWSWDTSCLKKPKGSMKVVCQLKGFADIGLATCFTADSDCEELIATETADLKKLSDAGLTVVPFSPTVIKVPCNADPSKTCAAYLLQFIQNPALLQIDEDEYEAMLKPRICKGLVAVVEANTLMIAEAGKWEKSSDKFKNFAADMQKIYKFFIEVGVINDFQGLLDLTTGHFFVADPQKTEETKCTTSNCILTAQDNDYAIMTKLGISAPS